MSPQAVVVRREIFFFNKDMHPRCAELELTRQGFLLISIAAEFRLPHLVEPIFVLDQRLFFSVPCARRLWHQ
jgi:hypothetical protein